jgi:hypothetical protein
MVAALSAQVLRPAFFISMEFASSTSYVWSGLGPMTWNGMTFEGVGVLGSISTISEGSTVEAQGITIELSGINPTSMNNVLNETRILGTVNIWIALFDGNGVLIPDPFMSYQGKMDQPSISDDNKSCSCAITVENILVDLNRQCYRRFTNDDQQIDLAATLTRLGMSPTTTDTGFRWVPTIQEAIIFWGTSPSSSNNV